MSKVAEAIPVATRAAKNNTPFFSKGGGSFLSSSTETESPFFTQYNKPAVQAKLTIGQPNDKYEQEADAVAEKVVQKLNDHSPLQTKPLVPATSVIQPKCAECENEELQKKEDEAKDETIPECKTSLSGADLPGIPPSANENTHNKTNSAIQLKCSACEAESSESFQKEEKPEIESKRIPLQAKLNIGTPGDPFEKEADAVADQVVEKINQPTAIQSKPIIPISSVNNFVLSKCDACEQENSEEQQDDKKENSPIEMQKKAMGMSVPDQPADDENSGQKNNTLQLRCDSCLTEKIEPAIQSMPIYKKATHPMVRRKCSECEKEDKLQRSEDNSTDKLSTPSLESRLSASRGGGFSLPESVRQGMESSIGADFGDVKIHTDSSAVQLNKELNAQAFAHGSDIYFNSGKYNPENKDGQHLLAHELTHTVQQGAAPIAPQLQRYSWDEFTDDVSGAVDTVGDGLSTAADVVADTASDVVDRAGDVVDTVRDTANSAIDTVTDAVSAATDWLASEAGQLAQAFADALGGYIRITDDGLVITIPGACPLDAITREFNLDAIADRWMVQVFKMQVGPNLFITGEIGLAGTLLPEIQVQLGPICFDDLSITINPVTSHYSVSGGISLTSAASIGAEIRGGVRGDVNLETSIVVNGEVVELKAPLVGVEGGLAGMVRAIGAQRYHFANTFSYSGGTISASPEFNLDMGLGADLFAGAYAQLDIRGENVCRIYWQPYEWHGGIAYSLGLSGNISLDGLVPSLDISLDPPTLDRIPFDSIPLAIDRGGFSDDCPIIDRVCEILRRLNLLPSQNGGVWDWAGTGHGGTYGPGPRLPGPMEVYQTNPGIASGSTCRGACGPNCETCEDPKIYHYTDPFTGQVWEYENFRECNSHDGCRQHDAAFDWAAAERGEAGDDWAVTILPWHMAANIECACNNLAGNCIAWIIGLPPYDMKMYFADRAYPISSVGPQTDCNENNPDFTDCTLEGSDRDEVLVLWGLDNGYENFRNCSPHRSFPPGVINACDLGPGQTWHCTATDVDSGEDVTISIFECLCCGETGLPGSDWRSPHLSIRLGGIDDAQSRGTPMLSQQAFNQAQNHIRARNYAAALEVVVADLVTSGRLNPSLYTIRYVARGGSGDGLTSTSYDLDPTTGNYVPDGPSDVEIYTPAFASVQWLVSTIMHEYQHVLQAQRPLTPAEYDDTTGEHLEADELESYLWEVEHADETGMAAQPRNMRETFSRLRTHYNNLGAINPVRQETYRLRYEAAQQFVNDLEEAPPPLPGYAHVFHHGSDYDTVEILRTADITATGGVDFGRGFYVHTKDNWRLAREWAIRHSLGKRGWGVVTFPVPDQPWREEIDEQLYFRNTRSHPANMPINPETGRPFRDWRDFVEYNKRQGRRGNLPDWSEFDIVEGPLWGRLSRTPGIHQVMFTSSGVGVLNRADVKPLRIMRRWLFLRYR